MTHSDEVRRLLGPHDPGHLSYSQDIALGDFSTLNLFEGVRLKKHGRLRRRKTSVEAFAPTSTIRARPDSLKCVNSAIL